METFNHLHSINIYKEQLSPYKDRFVAEIRHQGLGTYRVLKDSYSSHLQNKIDAQFYRWDQQWSKQVEKQSKINLREAHLTVAECNTKDAQEVQKALKSILEKSLKSDNTVHWEKVKRKDRDHKIYIKFI
jgi:hypothetical protein